MGEFPLMSSIIYCSYPFLKGLGPASTNDHFIQNQQSRWLHALWGCFVWWPAWC